MDIRINTKLIYINLKIQKLVIILFFLINCSVTINHDY